MQNKKLTKLDIIVLILLLSSIVSFISIKYDDYKWKADINNYAENKLNFAFDNSGIFYTVQKHNLNTKINISDNKTLVIFNNT